MVSPRVGIKPPETRSNKTGDVGSRVRRAALFKPEFEHQKHLRQRHLMEKNKKPTSLTFNDLKYVFPVAFNKAFTKKNISSGWARVPPPLGVRGGRRQVQMGRRRQRHTVGR